MLVRSPRPISAILDAVAADAGGRRITKVVGRGFNGADLKEVAIRIADSMKQQALTRREEDILAHMMVGLSNKGIASKLALAVGTVKTHVKSILRKLDATSRTEAAAIAQRRGILQQESESLAPQSSGPGPRISFRLKHSQERPEITA